MIFIVVILTFFVVFLVHQLYWKRRNLPPGPMPLPVIGNMHTLMRNNPGYEIFAKWAKQYGPVHTFWLGTKPFVLINTWEKIKDTFVKDGDSYVNKKSFGDLTEIFRGGPYGIIDTNGEVWREHRRFALHTLRDFGLGKNLMQDKILIEVDELCREIESKGDQIVHMKAQFERSIGNVINQIIFGYRFENEHLNEFEEIMSLLDRQQAEFSHWINLVQIFVPALAKLLGSRGINVRLEKYRDEFFGFFYRQIDIHKKEVDFDVVDSKDFCEAYLKEQGKREAQGDAFSYSDKQLVNVCLDIWFAGLQTTVNTLTWIFAYGLYYPGVQQKIHEELDKVIGSDRHVLTSDKNNLVYVSAFINESQRMANILPINLLHEVTRDVVIDGFPLPKGTGVIAQIGTVMYDENVFPEHLEFRPERFIDEHGKLKKVEELNPFSVGKRQCPGESLARMELFLFTANLFNRFEMKTSNGEKPDIDKTKEGVVQARHLEYIFNKRF